MLHTALPFGMYLTSGSCPKLPTKMTLLIPRLAMFSPLVDAKTSIKLFFCSLRRRAHNCIQSGVIKTLFIDLQISHSVTVDDYRLFDSSNPLKLRCELASSCFRGQLNSSHLTGGVARFAHARGDHEPDQADHRCEFKHTSIAPLLMRPAADQTTEKRTRELRGRIDTHRSPLGIGWRGFRHERWKRRLKQIEGSEK